MSENETLYRIAKRIVTYMLEAAEQGVNLEFFQGLGMSLAVVYEEVTGRTAADKKPRELMQWALNLPDVRFPHVSSS